MSRFAQAAALLRLTARAPSVLGALARWRPFSTTAFAMTRALRAQGLSPALVLDGGANAGQFARAVVETFPQARVLSFEPLPDVAARFRVALADTPRVRLVEAALGSASGELAFGRNAYSLASSALPVLVGDGIVAPHTEIVRVPVTTLDAALVGEDVPAATLLKLDLQGFELEALRGATATLGRVEYVLLEVALQPTYDGEPTFENLVDHLRPFGFRFLRPVDVLWNRAGEAVQMDALFGRA